MTLAPNLRSALACSLSSSLAQCAASDTAFYFQDREYCWQDVRNTISSLDQLLNKHPLGELSRVAFIARSRPLHISCLWGLLTTDRCASMIHCYQSTAKIISDIRKEGYRALIADQQDWNAELLAAVQDMGCLGIAITEHSLELRHCPEPNTANHAGSQTTPANQDDTATAIETLSSGTTGAPKRIQLSRRNLAASTEAAKQALTQMNASASQPAPIISVLPLSNISGVYASTPALAMGMPMAILEKFQLDDWLAIVQRFKPVAADIPPAAMAALRQRQLPKEVFSSIKVVRTGAAPLDREVQAYFQNELGIPVNLSYGASEFCGVITSWTMAELAEYSATKMGSCGRALPGVELRISDPDTGAVLATNEVGRLEAKVERVGPDWIATSDQARLDEDGFMWFEGRLEETIFRGGFKLAPLLIAEQLRRHPALADAAVIGVDDPRLGQVPIAALVLKAGQNQPSDEELNHFAREHLSATEIPSAYYFVDELPRTSSYKISLVELRKLIEAF
ncbi:class I adenylate-forming enzyme family protein [Zhongshania guokunii]|uniref:Class I adenylate-forming enzyme family protein n=1 Tax=Zhongshania guokunii TaxID=641783 RepID=A0ABV3UAG7_9GAMM